MRKGTESIEVQQLQEATNVYKYRVMKAVNILNPKVGMVLTEAQVDNLIDTNVKVSITRKK